eukprot:372063_1
MDLRELTGTGLVSPHSSSFIASSLIHKQAKQAPILYITGSRTYRKGVFKEKEQCTEALWNEMTSKKQIQSILRQWKKRTLHTDTEISMKKIAPFRMVLHKTNKMKLLYSRNGGMKGASKCKYFALVWIPSNVEDGMTENEFNEFIIALQQSQYFVNKLNKECIYISGPTYGSNEETMNDDRPEHFEDDSDEKFDLIPLASMCRSCTELSDDTILDVEIVVHELSREKFQSNERHHTHSNVDSGYPYEAPKIQDIEMKATEYDHVGYQQFSWHQRTSVRKVSFGGSLSSQFSTQPLPHEAYDEIKIKSKSPVIDHPYHVFAFVWFNARKKGKPNAKLVHGSQAAQSTSLSQSLLDDSIGQPLVVDRDIDLPKKQELHEGILPTLSVMNKLHQQPYSGSRLYNIEIMGYDECYENLDLKVDRNGLWCDAFLVFIQALFIPFFILFPPIWWIKCFDKDFAVKPRYRPVGELIPNFDDLDKTEQIPYDIAALWRSYRVEESGRNPRGKQCCFRFISALIAFVPWCITFCGPFLYRRAQHGERARHLLFFDCFGPLIFYGLGAFTVMWWACHARVLIGPKEHLLLYNKLIVYRPIKQKDGVYYNAPRTDWAALTNLSQPTLLTAFTYAFRKGFLVLRTPTHDLLSTRRFRCEGKSCCNCSFKVLKTWIMYILFSVLYIGAQNLENLEEHGRPFYIDRKDMDSEHKVYYFRWIFCILSNILSWILLWCFILLWETMIDRIARQHDNLKSLSNLITRNTYSEYIEFDYVDNLLSWLALENFIKRKGMMLFSSLETPLFSLFVLSFISWSCTIYCIFKGVGLTLHNDSSLFSNSALATWFYLATLSFVQVSRMLWFGRRFNRETDKQDTAIKNQCGTIHSNNLMQFLKKDKLSLEQTWAMQSSQILLTHINHNDIVPTVFGVKFDKLTAKAAWTAVISLLPTIGTFIISKIHFE